MRSKWWQRVDGARTERHRSAHRSCAENIGRGVSVFAHDRRDARFAGASSSASASAREVRRERPTNSSALSRGKHAGAAPLNGRTWRCSTHRQPGRRRDEPRPPPGARPCSSTQRSSDLDARGHHRIERVAELTSAANDGPSTRKGDRELSALLHDAKDRRPGSIRNRAAHAGGVRESRSTRARARMVKIQSATGKRSGPATPPQSGTARVIPKE